MLDRSEDTVIGEGSLIELQLLACRHWWVHPEGQFRVPFYFSSSRGLFASANGGRADHSPGNWCRGGAEVGHI